MQCPVCGGGNFRPTDGGTFECVEQIHAGRVLVGVVPRGPFQPCEVPIYHPVYRVCGSRFTTQQAAAAAEKRARVARQQHEAARARAEVERARQEAETERLAMEREVQARRLALERARDAEVDAVLPRLARPETLEPLELVSPMLFAKIIGGSVGFGWLLTVLTAPQHMDTSLGDPSADRIWAIATGTPLVFGLAAAAVARRRVAVRHARARRLYFRELKAAEAREARREEMRASLGV
jgi:hypothetical protein